MSTAKTKMTGLTTASGIGPEPTCALCPRLVDYRRGNRDASPDWHNGPVASFGRSWRALWANFLEAFRSPSALKTAPWATAPRASRTLRPFIAAISSLRNSRHAETSAPMGLLAGGTQRTALVMRQFRSSSPSSGAEVSACREFLSDEIAAMKGLKVLLALGAVAHGAVLSALGERKASRKFAHNALHDLPNGLKLADSYHCSRYNTNTGRLTDDMFHDVFSRVRAVLDDAP